MFFCSKTEVVNLNKRDNDLIYAWKVLPVLSLSTLLILYTEAMLIPSIPHIQMEFSVSEAEVSWVLTAYLISGTVSSVIFGSTGDIYGKKKVLLAVLSLYTLGLLAGGFAFSFNTLIASRALQGVGMAMVPLAISLAREQFPKDIAPMAQGIISAMNGLGMIIAFPLGAWISQNFGWRANFQTAVPFAVLIAILIAIQVRESIFRREGRDLSIIEIIFFSTSITSSLILISKLNSWGIRSWKTSVVLFVVILSSTAFLIYLRKSGSKLIPLDVLNRNVKAGVLSAFMVAIAFQIILITLTYLFQTPPPNGYGLNRFNAGLSLIPIVIALSLIHI